MDAFIEEEEEAVLATVYKILSHINLYSIPHKSCSITMLTTDVELSRYVVVFRDNGPHS